MNNLQKLFLIFLIFLILPLTYSCGSGPDIAGATSETTNGMIVSFVVNSEGNAVANAQVFYTPADSVKAPEEAKRIPRTLTDSKGRFILEGLDKISYTIEVIDSEDNAAMAVVVYDTISETHFISENNRLQLKPSGGLFGRVETSSTERVYVQLYGLHRTVTVDSSGYFSFNTLPEGPVSLRIISDTAELFNKETFLIESGRNTDCGIFRTNSTYQKDSLIVRRFLDANDITKSVSSVTKKKQNRITQIKLDSIKLDTFLPELTSLQLTELSLACTELKRIPQEIGNLTKLSYLDISGNELDVLPETISKLESCEALDIGDNMLTSLPSSIVHMKKIKSLYLNDNYFKENLPLYLKEWIDTYSDDNRWFLKQKKDNESEKNNP